MSEDSPTPLKWGDTREDGYRFQGWKEGANGTLYPKWLSPEAWNRYLKASGGLYQHPSFNTKRAKNIRKFYRERAKALG